MKDTQGLKYITLEEANRYFTNSRYNFIVTQANDHYFNGNEELMKKELMKLPTRKQLLDRLISFLQGKSVFTTLQKMMANNMEDEWMSLKGMSSLYTHIVIECERGNYEYSILLQDLYEKIGELMIETTIDTEKLMEVIG